MRALSHWLKTSGLRGDAVLGRLFKNAGILLSGTSVQSVLALAASALMARALGVESFGIFVTINTYIIVVDKLVNFQSWQALIKYGSDAIASDDSQILLKRLFKFGVLLDAGSALLGTLVAFAGVMLIAGWQNWDEQAMGYAMLSSVVVLFNLSGTPTAILRLYDRFDAIALTGIATAFARVVMYGAGLIAGAGLATFVYLWIISMFIQYGVLLYFGWRELLRHNLWQGMLASPLRGIRQTFPGIVSFVLTTNIHGSIRMTSRELDVLIINSTLGAAAAGLFLIVKQLTGVLLKLVDPIYQAIYPELARLWTAGDLKQYKRLMILVSAITGTGGLIIWAGFILFGEIIIGLTFGPEYADAYQPLIWYALAVVIAIATVSFHLSLLAMGRPNTTFVVMTTCTVMYFILLYPFINLWGLVGVSIAYLTFYVIWVSVMFIIQIDALRKRSRQLAAENTVEIITTA
jgi:O-antigen/teichoic acid export membrane protein